MIGTNGRVLKGAMKRLGKKFQGDRRISKYLRKPKLLLYAQIHPTQSWPFSKFLLYATKRGLTWEIWRRKSPLLCSCDVEVKKEQKLQEGRKISAEMPRCQQELEPGVRKQWYGCKLSRNTYKQWGRFWVYYKKLYNDSSIFIWTLKGNVSPGSTINLQFTCLHRCTEAQPSTSAIVACSQF